MKEGFVNRILSGIRKRSFAPKGHLHSYCLGLDIVGYSKRTTDVQCRMVKYLQDIVERSPVLGSVDRRNLVFLPTGDGMIICLLGSDESPLVIVELAEQLQSSLKKKNEESGADEEIVLRMGIHSGTGASYIDINGNINIAGTVANTTQRVMGFGEGWHIIASKTAFDNIATLDKNHQKLFHHIGTGEAKHKDPIIVYNVYRLENDAFGNPETPFGIQQLQRGVPTQQTRGVDESSKTGREVDQRNTFSDSHAVEPGPIIASLEARAKDILRQCVSVLNAAATFQSGLAAIRGLQKSWDQTTAQVSVVINDRFALHARQIGRASWRERA